jgi:uncharacterized cupredoxin-like copper-binding protein
LNGKIGQHARAAHQLKTHDPDQYAAGGSGSHWGGFNTLSRRSAVKLTRRNWLATASGVLAALCAGPVFARTSVIKVSLWDKGATSMNTLGKGEPMGMAMGAGGVTASQAKAPMGIRVSSRTVKAGDVKFQVTNASTQMVHEMVVSPLKDTKTALPYDKAENKVIEDAAGHLGEVAELEPGKKGELQLNLKPGNYLLYCNIAGHYALGMWTLLTVKV